MTNLTKKQVGMVEKMKKGDRLHLTEKQKDFVVNYFKSIGYGVLVDVVNRFSKNSKFACVMMKFTGYTNGLK